MPEPTEWKRQLRETLRDPMVIFALATALIVLIGAPFFALANASS